MQKPILLFFLLFSSLMLKSQDKQFLDLDKVFITAKDSAKIGKYKEALILNQQILHENRNYIDGLVLNGKIYAWMNNFDSARFYLNRALEIDSTLYEALNSIIDIGLWSCDYSTSLIDIENALNLYPNDTVLLLKKSKVLGLTGNYKEALKINQQILNINKNHLDAIVLSGRINLWMNKYDTAYLFINRALQIDSSYYDANITRVDIGLISHNYSTALNDVDKALKFYPNDTALLIKKLKSLGLSGKYKEALNLSCQILSGNNNKLDVIVFTGCIYSWQNKLDTALIFINRALQIDSLYYDALIAKVDIWLWNRNFISALEDVERALNFYPNDTTLLIKKFKALGLSGKYADALNLSRQLLANNNNKIDVLVYTGRIYSWIKVFDSASIFINRALQIDSSYYDALISKVDIGLWSGNYLAALTDVENALKFYPNNTTLLIKKLKSLGYKGNYKDALDLSRQILIRDDKNLDVLIFTGRIFAWMDKFDSAAYYIQKALQIDSSNYEALYTKVDIGIWSCNYSYALFNVDNALRFYSKDSTLLIKKAKTLSLSGNDKQAKSILDTLLIKYPNLNSAKDLLTIVRENMMKNIISINYFYNLFQPFDAHWQLAYIEYQRNTNIGMFFGRLNYGYRFGESGFQLEFDAYPKFDNGSYFYFNAGYSPSILFPKYKAGVEYYQRLPRKFDVSFGIRYLAFDTTKAIIFTGSVSKYIKSLAFTLRPYILLKNNGISGSYQFVFRKCFNKLDNYIKLTLGYGNSPDEQYFHPNDAHVYYLNSLNAELQYNHRFLSHYMFKFVLGYAYEEYIVNSYRNRITLGTSFYYLF